MTTANAVPTTPSATPVVSFTRPADLDKLALGEGSAIIKLSLIDPSPFNPRKTFDKEDDAELDASIKEVGLLENLIVRVKVGGRFELMGGERRYRACKRLKIAELPCTIRKADDGQAMTIQIVENLQRQDLKPLEEAEAFAQLQKQDPAKWTAQEIAKAVGKTDRFVQQRIAIATGLSAPLKTKLDDGKLTVEAARTLAALPIAVQNKIPSWAIEQNNAGQIRSQALEICIPEAAAKFDVATYSGAWIEDGKGKRSFADVAQFVKLQRPAAEKKLAEVVAEWPGAEIITDEEAGKLYWADETYANSEYSTIRRQQRDGDKPRKFAVARDKCRAVVWIASNGQIRKALGVCSAAAISAAANRRQVSRPTNQRVKSPEGEKKEHKVARTLFNATVAKAAAKMPGLTDCLVIFNVLTDVFDTNIDGAQLDKLLPTGVRKAVPTGYNHNAADLAALWREIANLSREQSRQLAHAIILGEVPTWDDFEHKEKPVLLVAMAESFGVKPPAIALPEPAKAPAAKEAALPKAKARKPAAKKKAAKK